MQWYHFSLIAAALIAGAAAWNVPRAWIWLLAGAASFVVSAMWWRAGLPYGAFVGAVTDAMIVIAIHVYGRRNWEMKVAQCFLAMMLVDIMQLFGVVQAGIVYSSVQEAINYIAMIVIFTTGAAQWVGAYGLDINSPRRHSPRFVREAGLYLAKRRASPPDWQK